MQARRSGAAHRPTRDCPPLGRPAPILSPLPLATTGETGRETGQLNVIRSVEGVIEADTHRIDGEVALGCRNGRGCLEAMD